MDIKKLNESLDKLLEISDEKKQWAVDARKAQMLAAQANAERAKNKYEKTAKMAANSKPVYKADILADLYDVAWDVAYQTLDDIISPKIEEKDGKFMAILMAKSMPESFEEELSKLLEEMSNKYGVKYSYKVEGNKVIIMCNVPNNIIRLTLDDILSGKELSEKVQREELATIVMDNINDLSHDQLVKILNKYSDSRLFPSRWDSEAFGAYPIELAKALSDSNESEDISDIYNVFYKDRDLSDWKEAIAVWQHSILNNFDAHYKQMQEYSMLSEDSDNYVMMLETISDAYPLFIKSLVNAYKKVDKDIYDMLSSEVL